MRTTVRTSTDDAVQSYQVNNSKDNNRMGVKTGPKSYFNVATRKDNPNVVFNLDEKNRVIVKKVKLSHIKSPSPTGDKKIKSLKKIP
jgi:hypothetical protein